MAIVSGRTMELLELQRLDSAIMSHKPFDFLIVDQVIHPDKKSSLLGDFPEILHRGSFPLSVLSYGPVFQALIQELLSPAFTQAIEKKFQIDLDQCETMITVRGQCDQKADGHIHTDSKDKIISLLLYLNEDWQEPGGRLRLLNSKNLDDYAAEVFPGFGSMVVFRRCDHSFHGHYPFHGKRLSVQMNWVKSNQYRKKEQFRHRFSSWLKRITG